MNHHLPDRTGIVVTPGCSLLAALILSAILVSDAMALGHRGGPRDNHIMVQMLQALVASLGFWPTILLVVVLVGATGVWFARSFIEYRARVADDKKAAGL